MPNKVVESDVAKRAAPHHKTLDIRKMKKTVVKLSLILGVVLFFLCTAWFSWPSDSTVSLFHRVLMQWGMLSYRNTTRSGNCQNNLRLLNHAKSCYKTKYNLELGDEVDLGSLAEFMINNEYDLRELKCPSKGTYSLNPIGKASTCSVGNEHSLKDKYIKEIQQSPSSDRLKAPPEE